MASNLRIVLNRQGIGDLLRSDAVAADLRRRGDNVVKAADAASGRPGDHTAESSIGRTRARTAVYTETFNAMWREADDRTLTRALDAARD